MIHSRANYIGLLGRVAEVLVPHRDDDLRCGLEALRRSNDSNVDKLYAQALDLQRAAVGRTKWEAK